MHVVADAPAWQFEDTTAALVLSDLNPIVDLLCFVIMQHLIGPMTQPHIFIYIVINYHTDVACR